MRLKNKLTSFIQIMTKEGKISGGEIYTQNSTGEQGHRHRQRDG